MNVMVLASAVYMVSIASSGFLQGEGDPECRETVFTLAATHDLKPEIKVGQTVAHTTTSAFVLGFAGGALVLSPLSEVYGPRELYLSTFGAFVLLTGGAGLAHSLPATIAPRFLVGGLTGSFTQVVAPAVVADMFDAQERGLVLSVFTLAGRMGQNHGPVIYGSLDVMHGWRSIALLVTLASAPIFLFFAVFPIVFQEARG